MKTHHIISALIGGLVGLMLLGLTFLPNTVTRAEMVSYVEATTSEHLRILRQDLRNQSLLLSDIQERVIRMDVILAGRVPDGK